MTEAEASSGAPQCVSHSIHIRDKRCSLLLCCAAVRLHSATAVLACHSSFVICLAGSDAYHLVEHIAGHVYLAHRQVMRQPADPPTMGQRQGG